MLRGLSVSAAARVSSLNSGGGDGSSDTPLDRIGALATEEVGFEHAMQSFRFRLRLHLIGNVPAFFQFRQIDAQIHQIPQFKEKEVILRSAKGVGPVLCAKLLSALPELGHMDRKKIAALAEAHYAQVVPHNPLSPVSTAACLQLAACIPNFALQEYPRGEHEPPKSEIVKGAPRLEKGFLLIPDAPGIGVELAEDAQRRHPYKPREVKTRLNEDGSVMDQ